MGAPCRAATRGGRWFPGRLAAGALLWTWPVPSRGELYDGVVRGSYNMLAETAYAVGLSRRTDAHVAVDSPCTLDGDFNAGKPKNEMLNADFNSFRCMQSAYDLALELNCTGACFYAYDGDGDKWMHYAGSIALDVPKDGGQLVYIKACEENPCKKGFEAYTRVMFYKFGSDEPGVSEIKVTFDDPHEDKLIFRPTFSPPFSETNLNYNLTLRQGKDFTIEVVAHPGYTVGIEWIYSEQLGNWVKANGGSFSSCLDLADPLCEEQERTNVTSPTSLTCESPKDAAGHHVQKFPFKKFDSPRDFGGNITVCGYGRDVHQSRTNYIINIKVDQAYSPLLEDIHLDFDQTVDDCDNSSSIKYDIRPVHAADMEHFKHGDPFNGTILEWEILLPNVEERCRWGVENTDSNALKIKATAKEVNASIQICPAEDTWCKHEGKGQGSAVLDVFMKNNYKRHIDRDAPEWERTLVINVSAPDDASHHVQYRIKLKQDVSHTAVLSDIDFSQVPCDPHLGSDIEFRPDKHDYKCVWSWNDHPDMIKAIMAPRFDPTECPGCELKMIDPRRLKREDTLDMDFMAVEIRQEPYWWTYHFPNGEEWEHIFLLGESHVVPVYIIAADHMTKVLYSVTFEYTCPWQLSAKFSRRVSTGVAILAVVLAVGSAGNVMALSKQIQFMVLATLIYDCPDTFKQFAKAEALKIFYGDWDVMLDYPPLSLMPLPSKERVQEWFEHTFVKVKDSYMTGEVATAITKFCAIRELFNEPEVCLQQEDLDDHCKKVVKRNRKDDEEVVACCQATDGAKLATGALICFDFISWDALNGDYDIFDEKVADGENELTGLDKLYWDAVNMSTEKAEFMKDRMRDCAAFKRVLDEEDMEDDRRLLGITLEEPLWRSSGGSRNAGAPGIAHGNITWRRLTGDLLDEFDDDDDDEESVYFWDAETVEKWSDHASGHCEEDSEVPCQNLFKTLDNPDKANIEADTFPDFFPLCNEEQIQSIMMGVHRYQDLNLIYGSVTGRAGTFISINLILFCILASYSVYYFLFLKGVQYRLNFLEPGNLLLFFANVLYIPYAMKTGKLGFTGYVPDDEGNDLENVDMLFTTLERDRFWIMWLGCYIGLIGFPIAFVVGFTYYVHRLTSADKLMWHSTFGTSCWCDPTCVAARLPRIPWLKKKVPILPGLLNRYVRMCIPVLTRTGEPLVCQQMSHKEGSGNESEAEAPSESDAESVHTPSTAGGSPGGGGAVELRLQHSMQKVKEQEQQRLAKERRWESRRQELEELVNQLQEKHEQVSEGDFNVYAPWMPWIDSKPDDNGKHFREPDPFVRNMGLFNLIMSWEMRKGHHNEYKLDSEETFAMQQYLDVKVKEEHRLLEYNILKIVPHDGCLKASEPEKKDTRTSVRSAEDKGSDRPFWLDTVEDYFDDEHVDLNGRHKNLNEFGIDGTDHIVNSFGERLVYEERRRFGERLCATRPLAHRNGKLSWMKEPDQGWKKWEEDVSPCEPTSPVRYADKWQWISFERWSRPWNVDDLDELEYPVRCCGRTLFTVNPSKSLGKKFYTKARQIYLSSYRNIVEHHISLAEKVEIRKWVFGELMHCMDIKMKASYFSAQHPDYAKPEQLSLEQMARRDFHDSLLAIYTAEPTSGHLKHNPASLINYTIMKIEDTYHDDDEPWWKECDPVRDGEMRVQFDHSVFFQRGDGIVKPKELYQHRSTNNMVPENGYWSSEFIEKVKDAFVGFKRYMLTKPDGSDTKVEIEVELEHVPSLMAYTNMFKVNIPFDSLELRYRQPLEIIINDMGPGEQYNFGVEGLTLVLSVIVLSAQDVINVALPDDWAPRVGPFYEDDEEKALFKWGSVICALAFLLAKVSAFLFGMQRSMYASEDDEADEDEAPTAVSVKSTNDINAYRSRLLSDKSTSVQTEEEEEEEEAPEQDDGFLYRAGKAIQKPEILTLCLQSLLLFLIVVSIFQERREKFGLACIFLATAAMICVGIFTTLPALRQILEDQTQNLEKMWEMTRHGLFQAGLFFQRCWRRGGRSSKNQGALAAKYAKNITLTVTELGLTFNGVVDIDQEASVTDQEKAQIRKKLIYKIVHDDDFEDDEDGGPPNLSTDIRSLARFNDIHDSISIAFTVDQMMMSQPIPPIVACLQCINHSDSAKGICDTKFDNYLTLFKPPGWQAEFDSQQDKLDEMHKGFDAQINAWFRDTLGAVETQRTYTREIKDQLMQAILDDSKGGARHLLKVSLRHIRLPKKDVSFKAKLDKQLLYVTILTEDEPLVPRTPEEFPLDRMSGYFRVNETDEAYECYTPIKEDDSCDNRHDMDSSEILLGLTGETVKFKLCVWAQTGDTDELVGFSPPVDLRHRLEKEEGVLLDRPLFCSWDPLVDDGIREKMDVEDARGEEEAGRIEFKLLKPSEAQKKTDLRARVTLQTLTSGSGDSELTTQKIGRYADCWPMISQTLGVRLARRHLPVLRERLGRMQQLRDEMQWDANDAEHVKDREDTFLREGIRRAMGKNRAEIDSAIKYLQEGIADEEARMDAEEKRLQTAPAGSEDGEAASLILSLPTEVYRLGAREINGFFGLNTSLRRVGATPKASSGPGDNRNVHNLEDHAPNAYEMELAARIRHMMKMEEEVGAQIIHYVLMSEHIKPNKNWRPDALSPHVAKIVSNEIDDIPAVALTGLPSGRMRFEREEDEAGKPQLRNGRLCFRCDTNIFDLLEVGVRKESSRNKDKVYLYWTGRGTWCLSEKKGEPHPSVLRKPADRRFFWVRDPAATPDLVEVPWNKAIQKSGVWDWDVDRDIRINKSIGRGKDQAKARQGANCQETLGEIAKLFTGKVIKRVDPDLKDCLISMNSNYLGISWKDTRAEALIPFRKYILETLGSYNKAWELFTSGKSVYKNTCSANLANMLAETTAVIMNNQGLLNKPVDGVAKPAQENGRRFKTGAKTQARSAEDILKKFVQTYNTGTKLRKLADDIVHALDIGGPAGESEADGSLGVMEVERVYNTAAWEKTHKKNADMLAFKDWIHAHPSYKSIENFWADLTEGEGIDRAEFIRVVKAKDWQFIRDYLVANGQEKNNESKECERMANQLFKILDAQKSSSVSLNELKPATGEDLEDIDRTLMKYSIPLNHIGEVRIQTNQQASSHLQKRLRISVKTQFEEVEEPFTEEKSSVGVEHKKGWAAFRKGLDPDWQPVPNREFIEFSMGEKFFDLWDTVIDESDMRRPQEWVQNYDGEHIDHPLLNGIYLRHGRGAQRWNNGTYYDGNWHNHVYSGPGRLYAKYEDYAAALNPPLYDGNWERGKRHGLGELRWQQDMSDPKENFNTKMAAFRQKGISKIYKGNFKDDLFHGEGHLFLAKVPTGHVAAPHGDHRAIGMYPPYTVDPGKLLEFRGHFEADYAETYLRVKDYDPDWNLEAEENQSVKVERASGPRRNKNKSKGWFGSSWFGSSTAMAMFTPTPVMFDWRGEADESKRKDKAEACKDLMLEKISPAMKRDGSSRFSNFFEYMSEASQRSGPALTDLAMKVYGRRGGDAMHFKNGTATFASPFPGTTYVGDWWSGQPHGEGVMTHKPITYDGNWEAGKWHGNGALSHEDGYTYKGQWDDNRRHGHGLQVNAGKVARQYGYHAYRGSWEEDHRHGKGEMMFSMDDKSDQFYLHEGIFEHGLREGKCELYFLVPEKKKSKLGKLANVLTRTSYCIENYDYTNPNGARATIASMNGKNGSNGHKGKELASPQGSSKETYYKLLYFSGWFERDNMPKLRKSWLHLVNPIGDVFVGNWYFGQVTEDGTRQGDGCIYAAEAGDDAAFMDCVMSGKPYIKERLVCEACRAKDSSLLCCPHKGLDRHHLKYMVYEGQWHENLPHGIGVQFYPEVAKGVGGVYYGDFRHGCRHGRGTWQVRDKSFTYMPLPKKKGVQNWKDDMMHGVANVEDAKYVHDNVVYADNHTMMPFTTVGPPKTKFDQVAGWNVVFKGVRIVSRTRDKRTRGSAKPTKSMTRQGSKAEGHWHNDDTKVLQKVAKHNGMLSAEQFQGDDEEFDLLREPTELLQHEEDMLVLGGTGENAIMNGLYFKMTKSFGHSLWRMVKQEPGMLGLWTSYHQRYIFKEDTKKGRTWYIAPVPLQGGQKEAGCAAGDEIIAADASNLVGGPHCVRGQWLIWSSADNLMVQPQDLDDDADDKAKNSVDVISVQSIVGFTIRDESMPDLNGRLFVRHNEEFYERPVYTNEAGLPEETNLYLYWFKQGGTLKEGQTFKDAKSIRDKADPTEFFQPGCWVVSAKMGAGPNSFGGDREDAEFIIAYLNDRAATPYSITPGARWWVKTESLGGWALRQLRLTHQVLENQDEMMDFFDSSEDEYD